MKKFYLFSLMLGIVFGSLAITSCSSDDSKDNPTTGGSLVGKWKANISAKENPQNGSEIYDHVLVYVFNSDNTFTVKTSYFGFEDAGEGGEDGGIPLLDPDDPQVPAGKVCYDLMRFRYAGTYQTENGKLTLTFQKGWMYDYGRNGTEEERWYSGENEDGSFDIQLGEFDFNVNNPLTIDYSVNDRTLTLANGESIVINHHSVLTGTLNKQ